LLSEPETDDKFNGAWLFAPSNIVDAAKSFGVFLRFGSAVQILGRQAEGPKFIP
jgi:hypothetical protein